MSYRLLLTTLIALFFCSTAQAGNLPDAFTLSPMVGGHMFEDDQNLDDGLFGGLGLGYNLNERATLEAVFGLTSADGESNTDPDMTVTSYRLDALYHFLPEKAFVPYLAIGFGGLHSNPDVGSNADHFMADIGGGVKYFFNDRVGLRADVRYLADFPEPKNNLLYTAGLIFQFGAAKPAPAAVAEEQPVPEVTPAPAPAPPPAPIVTVPPTPKPPQDSDGDGVTDDLDQCPNTPAGVSVDSQGCPTKLTLKINFALDSDVITPEYDSEIAKAAQCINDYPGNLVFIDGHTDSQGSAAYNQQLSERRANAVKNRLTEKFHIPAERMTARGFGESQPIADNATASGREQNRRVDVACGATE